VIRCALLRITMTHSTEHLLNEREAAALLNLAVPTLRRWRWSGDGPRFAKIGRAVRYDPAELRLYIETQTRRSTSDPGAGAVGASRMGGGGGGDERRGS